MQTKIFGKLTGEDLEWFIHAVALIYVVVVQVVHQVQVALEDRLLRGRDRVPAGPE